MDGNQWLGQVIDNIPAAEIDGIALHAYGGTLADFHNGYVSQLNLIDSKGLQDRPVYITEWNKVSTEADMAQFIRDSFADLNTWNQTPGKHNIRCLCWFVYDADQQAGGGWNSYAIEYYKNNGEPPGSSNDVYTAFQQTVDLRYPAGVVGNASAWPHDRQIARELHPRDLSKATISRTTPSRSGMPARARSATPSPTTPTGSASARPAAHPPASTTRSRLPTRPPTCRSVCTSGTITISDPAASPPTATVTVSLNVVESPFAPADFDRDRYVDETDLAAPPRLPDRRRTPVRRPPAARTPTRPRQRCRSERLRPVPAVHQRHRCPRRSPLCGLNGGGVETRTLGSSFMACGWELGMGGIRRGKREGSRKRAGCGAHAGRPQ